MDSELKVKQERDGNGPWLCELLVISLTLSTGSGGTRLLQVLPRECDY